MIPLKVRWATFAIICIAAAFTAFLKINFKLDTSDTIAVAQLIFTILAFMAVMYSLYAVFAQLRKSMAKPKLKLAFNKECPEAFPVINICRDKREDYDLHLWILNNGNAVTKLFQIDFEIPDIFDPELKGEIGGSLLPYQVIIPSASGDTKIISFCNDGDFCVFVNNPVHFLTLLLKTLPQSYEEYGEKYEIRYRIYGDWAETQEGKLEVKVKK